MVEVAVHISLVVGLSAVSLICLTLGAIALGRIKV